MQPDWQLFWHQHNARPELVTSVTWGKGYTESLSDDGRIVRHHYDSRKAAKKIRKVVDELRKTPSAIWEAFER